MFKKLLMYTNPIVIPLGIGVLSAIIIKNLFQGVIQDTAKVIKEIDECE